MTAYVTQFRDLQLRLGDRRVGEADAYHLFLTGLKPHVRERIMMETTLGQSTLSDIILLAERIDQS